MWASTIHFSIPTRYLVSKPFRKALIRCVQRPRISEPDHSYAGAGWWTTWCGTGEMRHYICAVGGICEVLIIDQNMFWVIIDYYNSRRWHRTRACYVCATESLSLEMSAIEGNEGAHGGQLSRIESSDERDFCVAQIRLGFVVTIINERVIALYTP